VLSVQQGMLRSVPPAQVASNRLFALDDPYGEPGGGDWTLGGRLGHRGPPDIFDTIDASRRQKEEWDREKKNSPEGQKEQREKTGQPPPPPSTPAAPARQAIPGRRGGGQPPSLPPPVGGDGGTEITVTGVRPPRYDWDPRFDPSSGRPSTTLPDPARSIGKGVTPLGRGPKDPNCLKACDAKWATEYDGCIRICDESFPEHGDQYYWCESDCRESRDFFATRCKDACPPLKNT
jgi:hypothetical protein